MVEQLRKPEFITTQKLEPGTRVNMHLKVHSVKLVKERRNFDGTLVKYAECQVGDQFGVVNFWAKN